MIMSKKRIVYILSPGHSGSTLIEYYLSCYQKSVGIGEAYKAIIAFHNRDLNRFSENDRKIINEIPFWQKMNESAENYESVEDHYLAMYQYIFSSDEFHEYDVIIDSSKDIKGLKILEKHYRDILDVVIVFKDIRSWAISQIDNNIRKKRKVPFGYKYRLFLRWFKTYYMLHRNMNRLNKSYVKVSYDLFCLNQEDSEKYLKKHLKMVGKPEISNTNSLNLIGNRMKNEANEGLKIKYDYRWMHRDEWNRPWCLLPSKLKNYNYDQVWKTDLNE